MYVQITEYEVHGLSRTEYEQFCETAVPSIAAIPGLVGKLFVADRDSSRCAGIYTFTDRQAAEAYRDSDLYQGAIATNPAITNVRTRGGELLERPTRALGDALVR